MWARTRLNIDWSDIGFGAFRSLLPEDRAQKERALAQLWSDGGDTLVSFSVRSAFDLLLQALDLPEGSEIMFSALNVKGMINIARRHGLTAIPIDLDFATMAPRADLIEQSITPKTKAIVVAHLFGARFDAQPFIDIARRNNLLFIEDCAQCFDGKVYRGHPNADVALFSFGPLKTATALGGAVAVVRNAGLFQKMQRIQEEYPVQTNGSYFVRLLKFGGLKLITTRTVFGAIAGAFRVFGMDYEDTVSDAVRGVAILGTSANLRYRPPAPMLSMMFRRVAEFKEGALDARAETARKLRSYLGNAARVPSEANDIHTYWAFPIVVDDPDKIIKALRAKGFDGANLPRSQAVEPPDDRPKLDPVTARETMAHLMILPCYPAIPDSELEREAGIIKEALGQT
jgi:dTDP-4-amino-4,6-dideoxygalactose transaminase